MNCSRYVALGDAYSCSRADSLVGAASAFAGYLTVRGVHSTLLAEDMAYMTSVVRRQLRKVLPGPEGTIVTLTIGQDDLIQAWAENPTEKLMTSAVKDLAGLYRTVVHFIVKALPNAFVIGCTVPDPSHGTGDVPGLFGGTRRPYPWRHVEAFNDEIRRVLELESQAVLYCAEVGALFRKGRSSHFNPRLPLEPSAIGSSHLANEWAAIIDHAFPVKEAKTA